MSAHSPRSWVLRSLAVPFQVQLLYLWEVENKSSRCVLLSQDLLARAPAKKVLQSPR